MLIGLSASFAAENQWSWGGPEEARIKTIAISPQNNQYILIGTIENGIYKSTNGGVNWQHLDNSVVNTCMREIVFHPDGPDTIFAATYYGMYKSVDGEDDWYRLSTPGSSTREILDIEIHPVYRNIVFAGGSMAYYKSIDGGESWTEMNLPLVAVTSIKASFQHPNTIFLSTESAEHRLSVFKSDDLGETWYSIHNDLDTNLWLLDMEINPLDDNVIYVCGYNYFNQGSRCVAKTTDGGAHWFDISPDSLTYRGINSLTISPLNHNTIYLCTASDGLLVSTDGGQHWSCLKNGHRAPSIATVCVDSTNGYLYLGTYYHSIFRSTNGGQLWEKIGANLKHADCLFLAVNPSWPDSLLVTTYTGILYRSTDGGDIWYEVGLPISPPGFKAWKPIYDITDRNYIYVSYFHVSPGGEAGICRSSDGGYSWEKFNNGLPQYTWYYQPAISYFPNRDRRLYLTSLSGVFYSDSLGVTWEQCSAGLPSGSAFNAIAVSPVNPYLIFVENFDGLVYRTEDAGDNWQAINSPPGPPSMGEIVCDPLDENTVYAGKDFAGIYKSTDMGESWHSINGNLPPYSVDYYGLSGIAVNQLNPLNIFVNIVLRGCFITYDGGTTWSAFNAGLSTNYDYAVTAIAPSDTNRIFLGTYQNSVWAYTRTGSGIDDDQPTPIVYTLFPNYPNPFNSSTTIRYNIPVAGPVRIDIYDILGRKVQTLLDVKQQAGSYQVIWNADGVVSGIFYYRLQTGDKSISRPMTVIK